MEQKKILWIIASVGVFLLVVMGAALIINRPAQAVEPAIASLQSPSDTWIMTPTTNTPVQAGVAGEADEFQVQGQLVDEAAVNGDAGSPQAAGAEGTVVDTMTVYSGTTNVYGGAGTTTIDLNSLKEAVQQAAVTATNQAGAAAVSSGSSGAAAQAPAAEATKPVAAAKPAASSPAKSTSTAKSASTTKSTSTAKSAAPATAKAEPAKSTNKLVDQFWVQVASVTNKNNAEAAREALAANKIESEIFTHRADDGKLYYRLRVGPYTTRTEAEYWKGRIVLIEEFADTESYITNSTAKRQ